MPALLDTSALVACLESSDSGHAKCRDMFSRMTAPPVTTEAVLTETAHFLAPKPNQMDRCLSLAELGGIRLVPSDSSSLRRCRELMHRYRDLPMDYADATLVCLAEASGIREIWTLDSDFQIYRIHSRGSFLIRPQ